MNIVDVLLVLIILFGVLLGYRRGFILGIMDLVLIGVGVLVAFKTYRYVAVFFEEHVLSLGLWTPPLAFILCYVLARAILAAIAIRLIRDLPPGTQQSAVNKALGVVPGVINGLINAAIVAMLLLALPFADDLSAKTRESTITNRLTPRVEWVEEKLEPIFDKAISQSINKLTVEPESEKTIKLPFTVKDPKIREDLEAKMLEMVNEERVTAGLPALKADPQMQEVARAHSRDMFARGYFSHVTPEGKTLADRAHEKGVRFITAGENLALAQTLKIAHTGLMNSPGHRANILRKSFGRVGIGILDGGWRGIMVTQNFRN